MRNICLKSMDFRENGRSCKLQHASRRKAFKTCIYERSLSDFGRRRGNHRAFYGSLGNVHTHSLIHDDLPALDNDEFRRGKQTTHIVFGEAAAILAGDALLNYAYETAFSAFDMAKDEAELQRVAKALKVLAQKTGIKGMLGGQGVDVENDGKPLEKTAFGLYNMKIKLQL